MKKCKSGYYYCNTDKKCKPIPKGYRIGYGGYLRHDKDDDDSNDKKKNGNGKGGNGNGGNGGNGNGNGSGGNGGGNGGSNGGGGGMSEGSLHKWFKGSKSKDGKGGWVNVVTGGTCASDEPGEGTPKCVSSAKRASMTKAERLSAARRKKKADPGQQSKTGAAKPTYVSTDSPRKKKMKESYSDWRNDLSFVPPTDAVPIDEVVGKVISQGVKAGAKQVGKRGLKRTAKRAAIKVGGKAGGKVAQKAGEVAAKETKKAAIETAASVGKGVSQGIRKRKERTLDNLKKKTERLVSGEVEESVAVDQKPKKKYGKFEKAGRVIGGIGGSIGGGIGGAKAAGVAGSVVPVAGTVAGGLAGGVAGSIAGDAAGTKAGGTIGKKIDKVLSKKKPPVKQESYFDWRSDFEEAYGGTGVSRKAKLASTHPPTAQAAVKNIPTETDRGAGNKAMRRAGKPVEKKSPNYKAYVMNKEEVEITESDKKGKGSGSKDACYHKVKSRYSVWPSAYASGALVKCRKVGAANWGNSSKKEEFEPTGVPFQQFSEKCWKGYEKKGMKTMFGKRYPNCVKKEEVEVLDERQKDSDNQRLSQERGRSNYGKASVRNMRAFGKGGNAADPAERLVAIDARHKAHKEKRGVKTKGVKEEVGVSTNAAMMKARKEAELRKKEQDAVAKKMRKEEITTLQDANGNDFVQVIDIISSKKVMSDWRNELNEDDMKGMSVKSGHKRPTKSGAGMTQKGVEAYRRRNPGSKLKTAVTTEPSKLKKGSKDSKRRKSYCARSAGQMKKFPKAAKDPDSRLRQARRRWNC